MPTIDELAPRSVREKRLTLTLDPEAPPPRAFRPIVVLADYKRAQPEGVAVPMLFEVQAPGAENYRRRTFTRKAPGFVIFVPRESGRHLVILREVAHNRWFGSLVIEVSAK